VIDAKEVCMVLLKNILVATDFGDASDAALAYGRDLSCRFGATMHLLHVAENIFVHIRRRNLRRNGA
jgi:nucleotide-binding universal stress UspA family protein